jgi:hypothetical protein
MSWFAVVGLVLTAVGVIVGLRAPKVTAVWAGPRADAENRRLAWRCGLSVTLIIVGTLLQITAACPQ